MFSSLKNLVVLPRASVFYFIFFAIFFKAFPQHVAAKFDLIGIIPQNIKIIRPSVEVSFSKRFSALFAFEKGDYGKGFTQTNYDAPVMVYHLYGWGIMPELRYYPFVRIKPAPLGFFLGLHYRYRNLTEKYTGEDYLLSKPYGGYTKTYTNLSNTGKAFNFGFDVGYKYNLNVFTLEMLAGFGVARGNWQTPNEREHIDPVFKDNLTGLQNTIRLEISLGLVLPKIRIDKVLTNAPSYETEEPDRQEVAQVIIYRSRKIKAKRTSFDLYADDKLLTQVKNGSYYVCMLPPGRMKFKAKTETSHSVTLTLEKGKTYYLKCRLIPGIFVSQPYLEIVPPSLGKDETILLKK